MTAALGNAGLGLFGGAFNPPHRTHRRIAEAALQQLPVSELRVLPAGDHPHKRDGDVAPAADRLAMCELAFAGLPGVVVDDRELRRPGRSYTVTTLEEFAAAQPGRPLWFVIGADNLPLLPTWFRHHRLLELARIATFPRLGCEVDETHLQDLDLTAAERHHLLAHRLHMQPDAVAAADLRRRLQVGERNLPELLPAVEARIRTAHLYGT
ncbi:MAG: nicotinate (nicotinamide) nucleotide adenylyltransferase [Planctomycetota bacterium]